MDAARQLVMSHLRVVVAIARIPPAAACPADLIQEGNIGLMKAVKRFDPTRGVRLVSFAIHWIKAEIHEYILKNWRLVKIATTKAQRKLFFNLRGMKQDEQQLQPAEVRSIAAQLGVKPEEVVGDGDAPHRRRHPARRRPRRRGRALRAHRLPADPRRALRRSRKRKLARLQDSGLRDALASLDERSRADRSTAAGSPRATAPRCTSWRPNTACPPSASARSRPRRCRRCAGCWPRWRDHRPQTTERRGPGPPFWSARPHFPSQQGLDVRHDHLRVLGVPHVQPRTGRRGRDVGAGGVVDGVVAGEVTALAVEHAEFLRQLGGDLLRSVP